MEQKIIYRDDSANVNERPAAATKGPVSQKSPYERHGNKYSGCDERH